MSQKSSDRFVLNWTEACDRMISQQYICLKVFENGWKCPETKAIIQNRMIAIWNRTIMSEMGRKSSKSNESVQNPTDVHKNGQRGQKTDRTVQTWTKLPEMWRNSLKLGGEFLPISSRRFFSVESVIILTPDESNLFFSWKVHVRKSRLYVTLLLFYRKP